MSMLLGRDLVKGAMLRRSRGAASSSWRAAFSSESKPSEQLDPSNDWFNQSSGTDIDERIVPKPVPVLPDHLPQVRKRIKQKPWWKFRYFVDIHNPLVQSEEYTATPEYPEIFDPSKKGLKKQIRSEWYKAIRKLPSAEQKIFEITKHYSHTSYLMESVTKQYNSLPVQQAITRTHLIHSLPDSYRLDNSQLDPNLKQILLTCISNRLYSTKSHKDSADYLGTGLSKFGKPTKENLAQAYKEEDVLVDVVQASRHFLSGQISLPEIQVDYKPYVASSWWFGDFPIPFIKKRFFKSDTTDQCFLYQDNHALHIRAEMPLHEVVPFDDQLCRTSSVPKCDFSPLKVGHPIMRRTIRALPGFWPSNSGGYDFPYLIALSREKLRLRANKSIQDFADTQDVLDGMAIMSSFAWLTSLANNLGFTLYDALHYPLVNQVVITDGQYWSFYLFQLNNHAFHSDVYQDSPVNLCWSSGDMKLFESFEDGVFSGLNEDVLKLIVKFSSAQPQTDCVHDLRPYLSVDERPQQEKDEMRYSLRRHFAGMTNSYVARRKKYNLWEMIYKHHKDAPVVPRRKTRPKIDLKYPPFFP